MPIIRNVYGASLALALCLIVCPAHAQDAKNSEKSCQNFVQGFYDWYVPKALHSSAGPASDLALKYRKNVFGAELYRRLKEDSDAQAKVKGDLVGLDFDPFLNSQDPVEKYQVRKAKIRGPQCMAEVYSVSPAEKAAQPDVVAEVVATDTGWEFVNIYYPNPKGTPQSLLDILKKLRESRQAHKQSK